MDLCPCILGFGPCTFYRVFGHFFEFFVCINTPTLIGVRMNSTPQFFLLMKSFEMHLWYCDCFNINPSVVLYTGVGRCEI